MQPPGSSNVSLLQQHFVGDATAPHHFDEFPTFEPSRTTTDELDRPHLRRARKLGTGLASHDFVYHIPCGSQTVRAPVITGGPGVTKFSLELLGREAATRARV